MKNSKAIHWLPIICVAFVFYNSASFGQREANHWFLLDFHINFNGNKLSITGNPIPPTISATYASLSDNNGTLLFVTNRDDVYNKNFNKMPNGDIGYPSNQANVNSNFIIIPQPNSSLYYIFISGESALFYVIVDMSKEGGAG